MPGSRDTPHTWVEWSCSQLLQNTPLHPIAEWGRQRFGGADVPAERRLAELESSLAQVKLDPAENVPLLAPLLDIPLPQDRVPALAPEELRRRQLAALTNWVMAGARVQPVVLAFEDLHWADPTTLDVLRGIAERGALAPLVHRGDDPARVPAALEHALASRHDLAWRRSIASGAGDGGGAFGPPCAAARRGRGRRRAHRRRAAVRRGSDAAFVGARRAGGGIQAIPPTLQQSLMARLDRLGPAREVAQVGSVIGRGFSYGLLRDVAGMEDAAAASRAGTARRRRHPVGPGPAARKRLSFQARAHSGRGLRKSAQKPAPSFAPPRRRDFARPLRRDTPRPSRKCSRYHFTQAGMTDAAIEWWGKAGDQALRRSAFQEAISHLGKAIEMADKAGEGAPRYARHDRGSAGQRLKLQTSYGQALILRAATARRNRSGVRARPRAWHKSRMPERFEAYYGLWVGRFMRGELAADAGDRGGPPARRRERGRNAGSCGRAPPCGVTCLSQGDFEEARVTSRTGARESSIRSGTVTPIFRFGHDIGVAATSYLAARNGILGEFDRALELTEEAGGAGGRIRPPSPLCYRHILKAIFEMHARHAAAAGALSRHMIDLSQSIRIGALSRPWHL